MNQFLHDVLAGLSAEEKYLHSKYFYNEVGDRLFQKIMASPEYYLTRCEMEIFTTQRSGIAEALINNRSEFDVIELGAGDATKSVHLLSELSSRDVNFTYYPIDISGNVIQMLEAGLPEQIKGLKVNGLNGEYLPMLQRSKAVSEKPKVVLFLGSNIGNISPAEANKFCCALRDQLNEGDLLLISFDLKKDPRVVLDAYNDKAGFTSQFNLNLLNRINNELGANFDAASFYHYPTYDPGSGTCKSYLVSSKIQSVKLGELVFSFQRGEVIHTEISQKYTIKETEAMARDSGFKHLQHFSDSKSWFLDSLWVAV
jgi:L-histidine N-alpha-methyltransferase